MSFAARRITTPAWPATLPTSIYVYDTSTSVATATFSIGGSNDYSSSANVFDPTGTWLLQGSFSNYDVRVTVQSGGIGSGTFGSWLSLSSSRSWSNTADRAGGPPVEEDGVALLEIRNASTLVVVASTQLRIRALSTNA